MWYFTFVLNDNTHHLDKTLFLEYNTYTLSGEQTSAAGGGSSEVCEGAAVEHSEVSAMPMEFRAPQTEAQRTTAHSITKLNISGFIAVV